MEWDGNLDLYFPCLHRRLKAGFGRGQGVHYKPWLGLRENPGKGTFATPPGLVTGRKHQLRTEAAEGYFYMLERCRDVVDIRELFPIADLSSTLAICGELGVKHEYKGFNPEPFLIDFLIVRQVGDQLVYSARSLLPATGTPKGRKLEQLQIVHAWCDSVKLEWLPVDTSGITGTVLESLDFLRGFHRQRYVPDRAAVVMFTENFVHIYKRGSTLAELIEDVSAKTGEAVEHCLNHFRYAGWARFISVDIRQSLALNKPVKLYAEDHE